MTQQQSSFGLANTAQRQLQLWSNRLSKAVGTQLMPYTPMLPLIRAGFEQATAMRLGPHAAYRWASDAVSSPGLFGRLQSDNTPTTKVLLYLHGGGYVIGSAKSHRGLATHIGWHATMDVVVLDYRLAPEHPYPAAVDDAELAYAELAELYGEHNVVVAGDSAGGGLTIALLQRLRDKGYPQPSAAAVLSPWVDFRAINSSYRHQATADTLLGPELVSAFAQHYVGNNVEGASPLLHGLQGLAPVIIHVGSDEVLLDDAISLAEGISNADGSAQLTVYPGQYHVFQSGYRFDQQARESVQTIATFLSQGIDRE